MQSPRFVRPPLTQPPSPASPAEPPEPGDSARAQRHRRRAVAAESARVAGELGELFDVLRKRIAVSPAVASAQPTCPVCMDPLSGPRADACAGGPGCACHEAVRLRCCGGDLHRRCLLQYTHSQFGTAHFRDAMHDAIAWSARGEFVDTRGVVRGLVARAEFTACPLCRGSLFFAPPPAPPPPPKRAS